ncbi:AraC family transcriptional regulator [Amycolatopsis samaneae]|uniref:Helix-turn-helix transcriptional regulator n=1 Tax=Amycolatopsis samaneae TaxID=664691 RepID=A0ABW5GTP1_9PSEU
MELRAVASAVGPVDTGGPALGDGPECSVRPVPPAVLRAISSMHERYCEPITLTELAGEVFAGPFHFSRVFTSATGVTPGRFLTAVRLFEAKRLLLTTSLSVPDIGRGVGYRGVGAFTSRFVRAVGMTPSQYRAPEVSELMVAVAPHFQRMPALSRLREMGRGCVPVQRHTGTLTARLTTPPGAAPAQVLVGLFGDAIPQSGPVAFAGLAETGQCELTIHGVPPGEWTVMAVAEHAKGTPASTFSVGTLPWRPRVGPGGRTTVRLDLRAPGPADPPVAITLATRTEPLAAGLGRAVRRPVPRAVA